MQIAGPRAARSSPIVGMRQPSEGAEITQELQFLRSALERANDACTNTEQFMRLSSVQFKDNATIIQSAMQTLDHAMTGILQTTYL